MVTIVKRLGAGAFGTTYHARVLDPKKRKEWGSDVAIKVPNDEKWENILVEELIINAALHISLKGMTSRNIVKFLGVYKLRLTEEDKFYSMVMEYCPLGSLRSQIGRIGFQNILPLPVASGYIRDVCNGLKVAHSAGLYHRDIKPENILLSPDSNGNPVAKIGDFGISKFLTFREFTESCQGSVYYLPPDAIEGHATLASDIYSLGVVFYEMVTGSVPFNGKNIEDIFKNILKGEPILPHIRNPEVPRNISEIIMKMMEYDPAKRYQTADEVLLDLNRVSAAADNAVSLESELASCDDMIFRNNIEGAESKLHLLLAGHPGDPRIILQLGELYSRCRQYPSAAKVFSIGIDKHPQNAIFYRGLALALSKTGRIREAIEAMKNAARLGLDENLQSHAEELIKIWENIEKFSAG